MAGYGPETTSFSLALKQIGDRIEARFKGDVEVRYVYNILDLGYRGLDILWLVEEGVVTAGYQSSSYLTDRVSDLGLIDLPFIFSDNRTARAAMDGELGRAMTASIEANTDYRILGYFENGFRHMSNRVRPIRSPADMRDLSMRVLPSQVHKRTFELLGAQPEIMDLSEAIARVKAGTLENCEFINVESEFAALSVAIGASAVGARAYTATASQGLLFMAEAVYNAAGLGLPIVMTVGNRAIGAPINIWNDHTDSMAMKDAGWIQLYAETNQEAVDLHIQAFKLAERLSCPVMVCMDGFILTHAYEGIDIPDQETVDAFLPPYEPVQVLDPDNPYSIGAMVGPEAFTEVRYLGHLKQIEGLTAIPEIAAEFEETFGRAACEAVGRPGGGAGVKQIVRRGVTAQTIRSGKQLGHVAGVAKQIAAELKTGRIRA